MRNQISTGLAKAGGLAVVTSMSLGLTLVATACAAANPSAPAASAMSADRFGVVASDRAPAQGHGYDARSRHIADCLATYPNYDPETDRVQVRPGVSRRCGL